VILSRSADYGLRALIHLARHREGGGPVPLDKIATAQRVPPALLSKILQTLVKAKVLRSHKGYGGGFVLAADPSQLTLADVIQTIDGPFTVFECLVDDDFCKLCSSCKLQQKFRELQTLLVDNLRDTSIAELADEGCPEVASPAPKSAAAK
jgi:Rrf2 family protein